MNRLSRNMVDVFGDAFSRFQLCVIVLIGSLWLSSCEDDTMNGEQMKTSDTVSFCAEVVEADDVETKADGGYEEEMPVGKLTDGDLEFFVHTSVEKTPAVYKEVPINGVTRAAAVESRNEVHDSICVFAWSYLKSTGLTNAVKQAGPNFMSNELVVRKNGTFQWIPEHNYYWPSGTYLLDFYAYAPAGTEEYNRNKNWLSSYYYPQVEVNVSDDVAKQRDLLIADTTGVYASRKAEMVWLKFRHALTRVRVVGTKKLQKNGTVEKVELVNVKGKGYVEIYNRKTIINNLSNVKTFGQDLNVTTSGADSTYIADGETTFMMLPQTLSDSAMLRIVFRDSLGTARTLSSKFRNFVTAANMTWAAGTTVTYKINSNSINWDYSDFGKLSAANMTYTYDGSSDRTAITFFQIGNWRTNGNGKRNALKWKMQFKESGETEWSDAMPDWVKLSPTKGEGTTTGGLQLSDGVYVSANDRSKMPATIELRAKSTVGTASNPIDLSMTTGTMNTANCYVVNAPGYYKLPLVYGNAIKNGTTNESAYHNSVGGIDNTLLRFVDYEGDINSAYLRDNGRSVGSASLVWQDAPNLISNIKYDSSGKGWLTFEIKKDSICEGNAVIGVNNTDGNMIWSWHIWVSNEDLSATKSFTNEAGNTYEVMPYNLGYCGAGQYVFEKKECQVRLMCDTINVAGEPWTIKKSGYTGTVYGNGTYYQWGRKDPFPPVEYDYYSAQIKYWYGPNGKCYDWSVNNKYQLGAQARYYSSGGLNVSFKFPERFYGDWSSYTYVNMWNMTETGAAYNEDKVVKTVYDPCPVGFCVPAGLALLSSGDRITLSDVGSANINKDSGGTAVYLGNRGSLPYNSGNLSYNTNGWEACDGRYWTAGCVSGTGAKYLYFYWTNKLFNMGNTTVYATGSAIRPVKETD